MQEYIEITGEGTLNDMTPVTLIGRRETGEYIGEGEGREPVYEYLAQFTNNDGAQEVRAYSPNDFVDGTALYDHGPISKIKTGKIEYNGEHLVGKKEYDLAGLEISSTTYNNQNQVTGKTITQRFDDGDSLVTVKDENDKIVSVTSYDTNGNRGTTVNYKDGQLVGSTKNIYDSNGKLVALETYDKEGKLTLHDNLEYNAKTNYEDGKVSSFESSNSYYREATADGKRYYVKYNEDGEIVEAINTETGERLTTEQINKTSFEDDKNVNNYRNKQDKYESLSTDEDFVNKPVDNGNYSKLNGIDSHDRADMHDEFMHEGHVTQAANLGYNGERPSSFHETDDGVTDEKGNKKYSMDSGNTPYEAGAIVQLADNVNLKIMANTNIKTGNQTYKGNLFGNTDPASFSKLEYIATYAASGQYSVQDLSLTADALKSYGVNFKDHPVKYYKGTALEDVHKELRSNPEAWKKTAENLRSEVSDIKEEWKSLHDKMVDWAGESGTAAYEAIQDVIGKFEVTMGNIENALEPSCEAADHLLETLDELEKEEAELERLEKEEQQAKKTLDGTDKRREIYHSGHGSEPGWTEVIDPTPEWTAANKAWETAKQAVEDQKNKMDKTTLLALKYYYQIKNFQKALQTFKSFFGGGSNSHFVKDRDSVLAFNRTGAWKEYFQNYENMPVITNLSDYHEGDVIIHDDAHGYVYVVTGAFDPLTGTITIGCIDKDGKQIGSDVTIWDQREIVPIKHVREYDKFYEDYKDRYPIKTTPPTLPETVPGTRPEPIPGTHPHHDPDPTSPPPKPTTPPPTTPKTVPPTPTDPPTIPSIPTTPYVPGIPTTPHDVAPHTGLDAVYGNDGDSTQSSASLGALAGLAVGAAGLGLTGLMGEKEDKNKEDEEDKKENVQEIENSEKVVESEEPLEK